VTTRVFIQGSALKSKGHPMKKSLLLAAMLLSSAAQADVYFCSSNSTALLFVKPSALSGRLIWTEQPNGADAASNFIINTDKGFRSISQKNSIYEGSCETINEGAFGKRTTCTRVELSSLQNIVIHEPADTQEIYFTESKHRYGSSVNSSAGNCTKA
jgi:hypothetical protein